MRAFICLLVCFWSLPAFLVYGVQGFGIESLVCFAVFLVCGQVLASDLDAKEE